MGFMRVASVVGMQVQGQRERKAPILLLFLRAAKMKTQGKGSGRAPSSENYPTATNMPTVPLHSP